MQEAATPKHLGSLIKIRSKSFEVKKDRDTSTVKQNSYYPMQMEKSEGSNCEVHSSNSGFHFWKTTLQSAKYVVAPMVDQSELAWRMLSRKYGAELCYTPMLHASVFVKDPNYRRDSLQSCEQDRPLIAQFCGNDPDIFLTAAQLAEDHCDAIDLNLGCPQVIAKRGHYGAFLQDEWDLIAKMVKACHENLKVPITCKVRIFPSVDKTVQYAKMLEAAGCQLLTVHGRTREQKGRYTGKADWSYITAVRKAVKIPVFANGNIQYLDDVHRCLNETGVQGVMTAEGNLHNPALFHGKSPVVWEILLEYLDYAEKYPCPLSYMRGHAFKLCQHALTAHKDVRDLFASAKDVGGFRVAANKLQDACQADIERFKRDPINFTQDQDLPLPYWICQPYVRPNPNEERKVDPESRELRQRINLKRAEDILKLSHGEAGLSMNKIKKMLKKPHKNYDPALKPKFESCTLCCNPKGKKCEYTLCKTCCRNRANREMKGCIGHNIRRRDVSEQGFTTSTKNRTSGSCLTNMPLKCTSKGLENNNSKEHCVRLDLDNMNVPCVPGNDPSNDSNAAVCLENLSNNCASEKIVAKNLSEQGPSAASDKSAHLLGSSL
ncbi:tRNA-dihydrouridine(16/17) synthase [nad(p)(+)]-like [Plakobranchus ocellatus]|uniref:tRNA-dihydrouridine(16/17) synthase [NAD(P)(+)]-like n=1 Tax=Plakobranchus ocellatus TaxID=259542 RepID=A0AAV4B8U3_9GAST|nr:tRNA-dihydrouridine(16/17) synthase [nad(p)(+)]-like [Plakobranchus ocellatus]